MCLAIPGKIIKIGKKTATIQYPEEQREVLCDPNIHVEVGDTVMVQMGVIVKKLTRDEIKSLIV